MAPPVEEVSLSAGGTSGLRVICISDTHGKHRDFGDLPDGDVLVHGGDFTRFGRRDDAEDFNAWLGEQMHRDKIVVLGNHEANAPWAGEAKELLTNAKLLSDTGVDIQGGGSGAVLRVWGTAFYWPVETPYFSPPYSLIPEGIDLLVSHGPCAGYNDGGTGCNLLLTHVARVRPRAFVCGHIHQAHGVSYGRMSTEGITFINAANAGGAGAKEHSRQLGWPPVVLDF
jgi:3',5'-cyclic AMP phosphodiesterase CpdA